MSPSLDSEFSEVIARLVVAGFITSHRAEEIKQDHAHILQCARDGQPDDWSYYRQDQCDVMATVKWEELMYMSRRKWEPSDIKLYKIWSEATRIHKLMVAA